jgi:hypothetical protein
MSRSVVLALRFWPFVLGILIVFLLNFAERAVYPVIRDFVISEIQYEGDSMFVRGYMRKTRACKFVGVSTEAWDGSTWVELPLQFMDTANHKATRPTGTQAWGPWRIELPIRSQAAAIRMSALHSCHPAWSTETRLTQFPLEHRK